MDSARELLQVLRREKSLSTANRPLRLRLHHPDGILDDVLLAQRIVGDESICGAQALDATRWFARGVELPPATYRLRGGGLKPRHGIEQLIVRQAGWQLMRLAQPAPQPASPALAGAAALA